ncbi:MAG: hypothetical protein A2275_01540 [Bacteroidetes bacterium RIFOXYA12_FULL_35_11]|nr:MAG: hypothetical protein A2X01_19595 [Bacteroidetes bacterium GWF2_35_48]OFY75136.1 MAG: hypothetical protein A2275_01540 [Bacteroidetes bacterium RIFOXYA12_FULL_35_11]OFY95680.1 MAG: hypothetical protein A2491_21865 [Bacteroidetes bacterium RIFOXYC12_FULL_35_7]HBX50950.1 hypothetical protein [Bacteroidales bacterium]
MKNDYICPHCKGMLNVEHNICFSAKTKSGKVGLIYLNPEVGNYSLIKHPTFEIKDGEQLEFYCPICNINLESTELSSKLAKILQFDIQDNAEYEILFSKVAGEKCTYKLKGNKVIPFGEHQSKYLSLLKFGTI